MRRQALHCAVLVFFFIWSGGRIDAGSDTTGYAAGKSAMTAQVYASQDSIAPDHSGMSALSAADFVKEMRVGWNVGNSLEAGNSSGGTFAVSETAWGNPKISSQLIDSVRAAGFNAVRIPVAWSVFSDAATYTIKKEWLDRVQEVVDHAVNLDMYVVMNEHWDGGWLQPTSAANETATRRLAAIWKQVAIRFRDYGDRLLFAGTNEVMKDGDYGTPGAEYVTVQNGYNQTFVTTVRATGGRNAYRYLVVQAFNTNIDHAVSFLKLPSDREKDRLALEVHFYDPWEFTIASDRTDITQWGAGGNAAKKVTWDSDESHVDAQFSKMKTGFVDKGIPVILGEYAAMLKNNSDNPPFRLAWDRYVTQAAVKAGMVPFYWDPGFTSLNSSGLFDRSTGKQAYPEVITAIVSASPPVAARYGTSTSRRQRLVQSGFMITTTDAAEISLYDLCGKRIRYSAAGRNSAISLAGLPGGLYVARCGVESMTAVVR